MKKGLENVKIEPWLLQVLSGNLRHYICVFDTYPLSNDAWFRRQLIVICHNFTGRKISSWHRPVGKSSVQMKAYVVLTF